LNDAENGLARFLERRRWSGVVQVRLKNSSRSLYFECVLNAIIHDNQIVGASALARDVTEEREKEKRFTELFETLQEGVYFRTPENGKNAPPTGRVPAIFARKLSRSDSGHRPE